MTDEQRKHHDAGRAHWRKLIRFPLQPTYPKGYEADDDKRAWFTRGMIAERNLRKDGFRAPNTKRPGSGDATAGPEVNTPRGRNL